MKQHWSQLHTKNYVVAVCIVAVVAVAGVVLIRSSLAASAYATVGASTGSLSGAAIQTSCSNGGSGDCVSFGSVAPTGSSCVTNEPTTSSNSLYPLQHVNVFDGTSFAADNFSDYGNEVQSPSGYVATDHAIPTTSGLVIKGYPDPISGSIGGVTGGSGDVLDSGDVISSSGGFDICFMMSSGDWQNVHLVLISWPNDNIWADGENDIFEGNPQSLETNVHEIGSDPAKNVFQGHWPSSLGNGQPHEVSARWDPVNGYRFYLDGTLVYTAPISATVTTPTVPHHLAIQMQDMTESSTSDETATIYWMATYGYQ